MAFEYLAQIPSNVAVNIESAQRSQAQYQANQKTARDLWNEKKFAAILSKNRNEAGELITGDAMREADAAGLGDRLRSHVIAQEAQFAASQADIARARTGGAMFGAPMRSGIQIGAPNMPARMEIERTEDAVARQQAESDAFVNGGQAPAGFRTPTATATAEDGTVRITAAGETSAQQMGALNAPIPPQTKPRTYIEEALDYAPRDLSAGIGGASGAGGQGGIFKPDDPLFKWETSDDENAFRKYGRTLSSEAKATGMEPAQMLRSIAEDAAMKEIKPRPSPALALKGPEGLAEYDQKLIEHALSLERGKAAGAKAVADYRAGLVGKAKAFGEGSQTAEKFEADMGGRRAGSTGSEEIFRTRAVSETEKTQGETIAKAYQDLKAAKDMGGFEGDYAAAMARAKADGNVNEDAIVGHLVSMGAWPSDKAVALKNLMRESSGSLPGDIYKAAKVKFGDLYMADPSRRDKWYTGSIKNMRSAMQLSGYDVFPGRSANPTPAETAKMSPKEAMEAKRRAFKGKVDKKAEKPAKAPRKATGLDEF